MSPSLSCVPRDAPYQGPTPIHSTHALRARLYLLVTPRDLVPPSLLLPGWTLLLMCLGTK